MTICTSFPCSKRNWIQCWRYEAVAGGSAGDEMTQAFFVLNGEEVIVVRDGDVTAVDVQGVQGAFQQPVGAIAQRADHFEKSNSIRLAYQFAEKDRPMGAEDRQHGGKDGYFKAFNVTFDKIQPGNVLQEPVT